LIRIYNDYYCNTTVAVLVSLGIVIIRADGNECIIHDNDTIENCCNLGFGHSKFSAVVNKPKVYDVKNFCGKCLTKVYCDTITAGGGWSVIQRRQDGSVEFKERDWVEYEEGFGELTGEFWYGLHSIHCLISNGRWELCIDFTFPNKTKSFLSYKQFLVGSCENQYQLNISGFESVGLTDPFSTHALNGMKISSTDRDNDLSSGNCGLSEGGWWLSCHIELNNDYNNTKALLNGEWHDLSSVELKIRPLNCNLELVMHRYDILPIIQLADIKIHIIANTDNQSDMYINQNSICIGQNCHFKNTVCVLVYENNVIRVCKINFQINRPTITDTDATKMSPIKLISDY